MNLELSPEAVEYGKQAQRALGAAGGDLLVQRAEQDVDRRADLVAPVLAELGAWDLDPRSSPDELEAAVALCRSAGWWATPYPVAERLARPADLPVEGLLVVAEQMPSGAVAGLDGCWGAVTLDGARSTAQPKPPLSPPRRAAFVAPLDLAPEGTAPPGDVALALLLPCWTLLGMLDRALELTRDHVTSRHQFGQPLSAFQGVQFQITEAETERARVDALARYAVASLEAQRPGVVEDALALRLGALRAADVVFRVCHQLHGALGFCDESPLSWLSRYSQPLRRLPHGLSTTAELLADRVAARPLEGLYG